MNIDVLDLPTTRDEAWRWSTPDAIRLAHSSPRGAVNALDPESLFIDAPGPRLVFVDGVLDAARSAPGDVKLTRIDAATDHPLGRQASGAEGWTLTLDSDAATDPVQIVHLATGGANHVPASITLADDAVASVIETYAGPRGWANRLTGIRLGRSARLQRSVRVLQNEGFVSLREEASVGEGASLVSIFLGAGGAGVRVDGAVEITGEGAYAEFGGALLTRDKGAQECAVAIRHAAANGSSHQTWRAVAADKSTVSLAARVEVARDAQKTDGEQSLRGMLLDRTATVNLKPELEIFADDVKCAHGATVGELDARALFYLASRGIEPGRAKALLTRAFVADAIDRIGQDAVREAFAADADAWLESAL